MAHIPSAAKEGPEHAAHPDGTTFTRAAHSQRRSLADSTRELEALRAMASRELAKKYQQLFGAPTRSNNRNVAVALIGHPRR